MKINSALGTIRNKNEKMKSSVSIKDVDYYNAYICKYVPSTGGVPVDAFTLSGLEFVCENYKTPSIISTRKELLSRFVASWKQCDPHYANCTGSGDSGRPFKAARLCDDDRRVMDDMTTNLGITNDSVKEVKTDVIGGFNQVKLQHTESQNAIAGVDKRLEKLQTSLDTSQAALKVEQTAKVELQKLLRMEQKAKADLQRSLEAQVEMTKNKQTSIGIQIKAIEALKKQVDDLKKPTPAGGTAKKVTELEQHLKEARNKLAEARAENCIATKLTTMDTKLGAMDTKQGATDTKLTAMETKLGKMAEQLDLLLASTTGGV